MRLLFINMPIRPEAPCNNVPLGIYHLGAVLEATFRNIDIAYCDLNSIRPEVTPQQAYWRIARYGPRDVYLLSGLITTYAWHKRIAEYLRKKHSKAVILGGGGLPSNIPTEYLETVPVDSICIGPGEYLIGQMLRDWQSDILKQTYQLDTPLPNIDILPHMDWEKVYGIDSYIAHPIWGNAAGNLSSGIEFPFHMKRSLSIVTSRGCPFECAFCNRDITGGRQHRMHSAQRVVDEVAYLEERYTLDFMGFVDDNFAVSKRRLHSIAEGLRLRTGLRWGGHPRFDEMTDANLLQHLAKCRCVYLGFGGESANRDILAAMKKQNDPDVMVEVLAKCREAGIYANVSWMMGWPGETLEQVRETTEFILKYAPENPRMFVTTAYPKTELWDQVKDKVLDRYGSVIRYVEALGDATLPMVNYSAMPEGEFLDVAEYARWGQLEKI